MLNLKIGGAGVKKQSIKTKIDVRKKIIINLLYLGAMLIIFLGAFFSAYSVLNNIQLQVLNASVPGIVFGLLVVYLGIRYFFMVTKFKVNLFEASAKFSWSNFKRKKERLAVQKK